MLQVRPHTAAACAALMPRCNALGSCRPSLLHHSCRPPPPRACPGNQAVRMAPTPWLCCNQLTSSGPPCSSTTTRVALVRLAAAWGKGRTGQQPSQRSTRHPRAHPCLTPSHPPAPGLAAAPAAASLFDPGSPPRWTACSCRSCRSCCRHYAWDGAQVQSRDNNARASREFIADRKHNFGELLRAKRPPPVTPTIT